MKKTFCFIYPVIFFLLATSTVSLAEESGYFLTMEQKGQLIWSGRIKDSSGTWYDIWICPGYKYPASNGWRNIKEAGFDLHRYIEAEKYKAIVHDASDVFEFALDDCFMGFALKGSKNAWKKYFNRAKLRTDKRVFCWWLSYPWAFMQSFVDSGVRMAVGSVGTTGGILAGSVGVPVYHIAEPTVTATWHGGVEGVALPISGAVWNTIISPPMAMLGEKPSKSKVDGFWVRKVDDLKPTKQAMQQIIPPTPEELDSVIKWGEILLTELNTYDEQKKQLTNATNKKVMKIKENAKKEIKRLGNAERQHVHKIVKVPSNRSVVKKCGQDKWSRKRINEHYGSIKKALNSRTNLSKEQKYRLMKLLKKYPLSANSNKKTTKKPMIKKETELKKTDPAREAIRVIQEIDDENLDILQ